MEEKFSLSEFDYLNPDYEYDTHPDYEAERRYEALKYRLRFTAEDSDKSHFYFALVALHPAQTPNSHPSVLQGKFCVHDRKVYFNTAEMFFEVNRDERGWGLYPIFRFLSNTDTEFTAKVLWAEKMAVCTELSSADGKLSVGFLNRIVSYALRCVKDYCPEETERYKFSGEEVVLSYKMLKDDIPAWVRQAFESNLKTIGSASNPEEKRRALMVPHYLMGVGWDMPLRVAPYDFDAEDILNRYCSGYEKAKDRILELVAYMRESGRVPAHGILLIGENPVAKEDLVDSCKEILHLPVFDFDVSTGDDALVGDDQHPCPLIEKMYEAQTASGILLLNGVDKCPSMTKYILDIMKTGAMYDSFLNITIPLERLLVVATADSEKCIAKDALKKFHVIHVDDDSEYSEKLAVWRERVFPDALNRAHLTSDMYHIEDGFDEIVIRDYCTGPNAKDLEQCAEQLLASMIRNVKLNHEFYLSDVRELLGPATGSGFSDHV